MSADTAARRRGPVQLRYLLGMVVDSVGSGMYLPVSLLYFHHVTGLPLPRVGVVMTVAALLGLAATPVAGTLVDRYGARTVVVGTYVLRAAGFGTYALVGNQAEMFAAVTLVAFGDRSYPAAIQAFVAEFAQGTDRDRMLAAQRSIRNAGLGAGGLLASALIGLGSVLAYHSIVLGDAVSFLVAAALVGGIRTAGPPARTARAQSAPRTGYRAVLRDRPFLVLTLANLPTAFGYMVLSVALPVYLTQQLHTTASWVGPVYAVNTAGIALLQLPVTRRLTRRRRTRVVALGQGVFALSFCLFGALGAFSGGVVIVGVFAGAVLFTAGELLHGATASALSANAAPGRLRGRYLAFYQFSWAIPTAAAPAALTALLAASPLTMWLLLTATVGASAIVLLLLEPRLPAAAVGPVPVPPRRPRPAALT